MKSEEAKQRLACYRPGKDDPGDAFFAPAFAATETDSALADWFRDQQQMDDALRERLRQSDIPQGLLASLRETESAGAVVGASGEGNVFRPTVWLRVAAVAALIAISFLAFDFFNQSADAVEDFRAGMAQMAAQGMLMDHESEDLQDMKRWLVNHKAPVYDECPDCIGKMKGVGCKTVQWNDHEVSVICFRKDTGKIIHMFVIEKNALDQQSAAASGKLIVERHSGLENGGWVDDKNVYLLVGASDDVKVDDLL